MSYRVKMILPVIGMVLLVCGAVFAVMSDSREIKQPLPQSLDNLAAIKLVEIKEAGGQTILSGSLTMVTKKNRDIEGKATLGATGVDADAAGKAEVEVSTKRDGSVGKEFEVEVRNLAPNANFNLFVDRQQVAEFTTDQRGAVELEMTNSPSR